MTRTSLRLVFMGTPGFAVPALDALLEAGHEVVGVFTQPDRRSGRGRRLSAPPVKEFAESRDLAVFQPASLREDAEARQRISDLAPDAIVVAAYGLFLPEEILAVPRLGCLNIHPSLLPRHRGPSPVATAILEGDETTGVTIMLLDEGMDTGPILRPDRNPHWRGGNLRQVDRKALRHGRESTGEDARRVERRSNSAHTTGRRQGDYHATPPTLRRAH